MELTSLQNGRYQIKSILGQGGFGITYRAVQTSLGRTVAIKEFFMKDYCERAEDSTHVTMGTQSSREMVQRYRDKFEKEACTLARLKHPHIVPVIDVFQENNTSYYVMEYAEGASLKQQVDQEGPLSEARAVNYILQVADALRYLHGQHICHLDIKPANILTTAHGEAILADFGLAKQYDEEGGETSTTPVGRSKGYAPPEQYRTGGVQSFSPETDVYALGATLYFLLTGETPPESVLLNEQSLDVTLLSPHMAQVVQAAMQLRRADRVTLEVFINILNRKEKDAETIIDQPTQINNKPRHWTKQISIGLILIVLLGGLVFYSLSQSHPTSDTAVLTAAQDSIEILPAISASDENINGHSNAERRPDKPTTLEATTTTEEYNQLANPNRVPQIADSEKIKIETINKKSPLKVLIKAAEQGNAKAQRYLAIRYNNGDGLSRSLAKAVEWFTKAAEGGDFYAQLVLGEFYKIGIGVTKNDRIAKEYFAKAAKSSQKAVERGRDAEALYSLGVCYDKGYGVIRDEAIAVDLYQKAAELGNTSAMNELSEHYRYGDGVEKDITQAEYWENKAEKSIE
ncbi:serine/threonine-protein kinase [Bacteroides caecigallinarum]|uniref:serine/threonine-protein kinase n=1 Tax=Bacteroides caecigallinarum TaxID=1411144 RepID=UPI00195CB907|nr:serine/threonine-protein kinase [Bacteroides caecigallinarum]MBM6883973.1 protein kinase [Bacteroides caecigallinarum]